MQCPVVQHKGNIAHDQRCQRDSQRGGAQLLRNAARRHQQKYQPYMASTVPLHSSSLQTMRRTAGRMRSNFGFASG